MSSSDRFSAELIQRGASAYAGLAAHSLLEHHPEFGKGMGGSPLQTWKEHLQVRLEELAAALAEGRSETFVAQVHWSRAAWTARGVDTAGLRKAIEVLRDVLVEELPQAVTSSVASYLDEALEGFDSSAAPEHFITGDSENNRLAAAYLERLFHGDSIGAESLVLDAVRNGKLNVRQAYTEVLQPALQEIGLMWQLGEATVPDEHFATAVTRRLASRLSAGVEPAPANGRTVLATSVARETHDVGLQIVSESFLMDGWRVVNMGADVPADDIMLAVQQYDADILAISATMPTHRRAVQQTIQELREGMDAQDIPKILVGGLAFSEPGSWQDADADGYAIDAASAVARARDMLGLDDADEQRKDA